MVRPSAGRFPWGMTNFLVIGGTGKTGRRVADRLRARGEQVRIAARSTGFDWDERGTWEPALKDVTTAYVTYAPDAGFPDAAPKIGALARQAGEQGVRRLVLLTGRGEDGARRSEEAIQDAGPEWTVVRASFFAQNFSEDFLAESVVAGEFAFPAGEVSEPFIDADDIADVATKALTEDGHAGLVHEITGPRLLTFAEAAAEISAALGRPVRYVPVSAAEFAAGLVAAGVEPEFAGPLSELLAEVLDGRNESVTDGVQQVLGRPPRGFADFARTAHWG